MEKSNHLNQSYLKSEEISKSQIKRCEKVPPIDAKSRPLDVSLETRTEPRQKLLYWLGQVYHQGDCTIENMRIFFWSDGRARFEAHVRSNDSDDVWVFYDGISILDNHDVELWRSPKLIGPEMPWEGQTRDWNQELFYPAIWFDSIASATINQMHC